jgi:hypothetical protein
MPRERLITVLALMISAVWSIVAIASLLIKEYTALTVVTPVMLIVAGFLFGVKAASNNGKKL